MNTNPAHRPYLEMEIKYTVSSPDDLKTAKEIFLSLTEDVIRERNFKTTIRYYDTNNFDLFDSGTTLRKMDECKPFFKPEMHVKTIGNIQGNNVLVRDEYQFTLPSNAFDLSVIDDVDAYERLMPAAGKTLCEVFRSVNERNDMRAVFNVNAKCAVVELCIEKTEYVDAKTGAIFKTAYEAEMELSHRHSDANITHAEALDLMEKLGGVFMEKISGITPNPKSKAEIGFSFFGR